MQKANKTDKSNKRSSKNKTSTVKHKTFADLEPLHINRHNKNDLEDTREQYNIYKNIYGKPAKTKRHPQQLLKRPSLDHNGKRPQDYTLREWLFGNHSGVEYFSQQNASRTQRIQAKLNVSQPGDQQELEADKVAETVMKMDDTSVLRQSEKEKEEELISAKSTSDEKKTIIDQQTESEIQNLGKGKPLTKSEREFFEPRMGADFSGVRLHDDEKANGLAGSVNAKAFTKGNNIVFGEGEYSPQTDEGKKLMAHELAHVVQKNKNISRKENKKKEESQKLNNEIDLKNLVQEDISRTLKGVDKCIEEVNIYLNEFFGILEPFKTDKEFSSIRQNFELNFSPKDVPEVLNVFNNIKNRLPGVSITHSPSQLGPASGMAFPHINKILLFPKYKDLSPKEREGTLVHEMVHVLGSFGHEDAIGGLDPYKFELYYWRVVYGG